MVQNLDRRVLSEVEWRTVRGLITDVGNIRKLVNNGYSRGRKTGLVVFEPESRSIDVLTGLVYLIWDDEFLFADDNGNARFIKFENCIKGYQFPDET